MPKGQSKGISCKYTIRFTKASKLYVKCKRQIILVITRRCPLEGLFSALSQERNFLPETSLCVHGS